MSAFNIPSNWCSATINEVNIYQSSTCNPMKTPEKQFELYSVPSFPGKNPEILSGKYIGSTKQLIQFKDVLLCKINPRINRVWCVNGKNELDQISSSEWIVVRQPHMSERFLAHFLRSNSFRNILCSDVSGVGGSLTRAQPKKVATYTIPVAPYNEQQIIAEKLDTLLAQVDNTKTRLEQIPKILKCFRQAVLGTAINGKLTSTWASDNKIHLSLEDFINTNKDFIAKAKKITSPFEKGTWVECELGHVINVSSGNGLTAKEMNKSGIIPVYGGNGITGYHNKENTEESTIVIGRVGFYCGSVHLTANKAWVTDNALIVSHSPLVSKLFIYWLLKGTNLRQDASSSAQPVISGAKIYSLNVMIPPIEEQLEIVRRVEQLFALADTIEKQANAALEHINLLTQSILAKAFRGDLTAQWRAENPDLISGENSAAALLEKIKAERAAAGGKKTSRKKA